MSIGHNNIKVTQTLDAGDFLREIEKVRKGIDTVANRLDRMGRKTDNAGRRAEAGFKKAFREFRQFAGAVTGVGTALGATLLVTEQIRREYDNLRRRQSQGGETRIAYEDQLAGVMRKTKGMMTPEELISVSREFSEKTDQQVSETRVLGMIGAAVSARGAKNRKDVLMAVDTALAAAMMAPDVSDEGAMRMATTATSLGARWNMSGREALALMEAVLTRSNVENMEMLAKNIAPTMMQATQFGISPELSASLISSISQGLGDVTGEITATAMVNLVRSLHERFRHMPGGFDANRAIEYLRSDPEKMRQFFEGGTFFGRNYAGATLFDGVTEEQFGKAQIGKGKALPTLMEILSRDTEGQAQQDAFYRDFMGMNLLGQYWGSVRNMQRYTPVSQEKRALSTATQSAYIENIPEALSGVLRDETEKFYQSLGYMDFEQRAATLLRDVLGAGKVTPGTVVGELRDEAEELREIERVVGRGAAYWNQPTEEELRTAQHLERAANSLEKIIERSNLNENAARSAGSGVPANNNPQANQMLKHLQNIDTGINGANPGRNRTTPPSKKLSREER